MSDLKSSSTPVSTKIFVGGLSWDTTDAAFTSFFTRFGEITDSVIMRDKSTGGSRGFGFVKFADAGSVDKVLQQELELDGRKIDCKVAVPKEQLVETTPSGQRTKKLFVGGLSIKTTQEEFKQHFSQFGNIVNAVIMMDSQSRRSRGFGFVTYDSESVVDNVLARTHVLNGKPVELKRAIPKEKIAPVPVPSGPVDGYGSGYDRGYADPYAAYGYPSPYPPTAYPAYPGYEYPRPDAYGREGGYYGASRPATLPTTPSRGYGYETQAQPPAWQPGYPEASPSPYGARGAYPPTSTSSRTPTRTPAVSAYPGYETAGYGQTGTAGAYGYSPSRTTKPDRNYHPYGR